MGKHGGIVLRVESVPVFLPAAIVVQVATAPRVTRVPSAPPGLLGIALHEGEILPVVSLGSHDGPMVVCNYQGERVGLVGAEVLHVGLLEAQGEHEESVAYEGRRVFVLDLAPIYAQIRGVSWAGRWAG